MIPSARRFFQPAPAPVVVSVLGSGDDEPGTLGDPSTGAAQTPVMTTGTIVWAGISTISMAASAYHGYKRNNSVGWAIWWGLMGSIFPVITPVIAYAEGYAEPAKP